MSDLNNLAIPSGFTINVYASAFFGGILVAEIVSHEGVGLLCPVPDGGLTQDDIDAAVAELTSDITL